MAEFGVDEEERDTLSPLPSPEVRRRFRFHLNHHPHHPHHPHHGDTDDHMPSLDLQDDYDCDVSATSASSVTQKSKKPAARRHVHWSQDSQFNKFTNKKKVLT